MKRRIVKDAGAVDKVAHRTGVSDCPHCGHEQWSLGWMKCSVTLVLAEVWGKKDHAVVISECPKCFKKSWTHYELSYSSNWYEAPKAWKEAVEARLIAMQRANLDEWAESQCQSCKNLKNMNVHNTGRCYRSCTIGMGSLKKDCDAYDHG